MAEVQFEKEMMEQAVVKLTTRERELRKRIEDILDPAAAARTRLAAAAAATSASATAPSASTYAPLDGTLHNASARNHNIHNAINGSGANAHVNGPKARGEGNGKGSKKRKPNGEGTKKGKKRKTGE